MPLSVTTGRDLDEIAAESDRVWGPKGEIETAAKKPARKPAAASKKRGAKTADRRIKTAASQTAIAKAPAKPCERQRQAWGARSAAGASRRTPRPAARASRGRAGDARRGCARQATTGSTKSSSTATACSAASKRAKHASSAATATTGPPNFPSSPKPPPSFPVDAAMLDGEVVALNSDGTTSFQTLQNVFQTRRTQRASLLRIRYSSLKRP